MTDTPATAAGASSSDLGRAVGACDFPIVVWELPSATVVLANEPLARLLGRPLEALSGLYVPDLVLPHEAVTANIGMLTSGSTDAVHGPRNVLLSDGRLLEVQVWSRVLEVEHQRAVATLMVPVDEVPRLGHDPSAPWRELSPVAIGRTNSQWIVQCVTTDIEQITGLSASQWVHTSLIDAVHPDDRDLIQSADPSPSAYVKSLCHIRIRHAGESWLEVCLLLGSNDDPAHFAFAVVGPPPEPRHDGFDRVAELERRLRHIAAEVRAAGVIEEVSVLPSVHDHPQLRNLTTRQWEILSRLVRGERVPAIAQHLYLSQSTVRNHLTTIFQRFGVHSQSELLDLFRRYRNLSGLPGGSSGTSIDD